MEATEVDYARALDEAAAYLRRLSNAAHRGHDLPEFGPARVAPGSELVYPIPALDPGSRGAT